MEELLRLPDIRRATGLSRTTIWRLEGAGKFPKRIKLSARAVGWKARDIRLWIDELKSVNGAPREAYSGRRVSSRMDGKDHRSEV